MTMDTLIEDGTWVYYADEEYEDELNYDDEEETYQTYWIVETTSSVGSTQTTETGSSSTSTSSSTVSNGATTTTTSESSVTTDDDPTTHPHLHLRPHQMKQQRLQSYGSPSGSTGLCCLHKPCGDYNNDNDYNNHYYYTG